MKNMDKPGLFTRFVIYKVDCVVMLLIIGVQLYLFRGETPFQYRPGHWLQELLQTGSRTWLTALLGGTLYWTIVDYHPVLERYRESRVVSLDDGSRPDMGTRFLRSFIKSATLFGKSILLLFGLLRSDRRFLHDYVTRTVRARN